MVVKRQRKTVCGAEGDYDQSLGQTPVNPCLVSWVLAWTNLLYPDESCHDSLPFQHTSVSHIQIITQFQSIVAFVF